MALRIEAWLGVERGGRADLWLQMQAKYDMWKAREKVKSRPLHVIHAPIVHAMV
jgi:plasmid maintenance system antidote protein VapI